MTAVSQLASCPESSVAVRHITAVSEPASVFLYGSRARGDAMESSDYEFAALYREGHLVSRSQLVVPAEMLDGVEHRLAIYPFGLSDISEGRIETPFPTSIFLNELHDTAVGMLGLSPQEVISPPPVRVADSVADCFLAGGRTLAGLDSARIGDLRAARRQVRKARYTALRTAILLRDGRLLHHTRELERASGALLTGHPVLGAFGDFGDSTQVQRALHEAISVLTQELLPELQSRPASEVLLEPEAHR